MAASFRRATLRYGTAGATILRGLRWMFVRDAPLLISPSPNVHKYTWLGEFIGQIRNHRKNTIATTRLAIEARRRLFAIAEQEGISFDLERRGILHVYDDRVAFKKAEQANALLLEGGLDRVSVTPSEMSAIEPTLRGEFYGGFYTPSDATGDIHKFTRGLADACARHGARFLPGTSVTGIKSSGGGQFLIASRDADTGGVPSKTEADAVVICAGIASRSFAGMLGDRVNIYPVKGYSISVRLLDESSQAAAPWVSLLDDKAKIVTSRLGVGTFRVAGTAEFKGANRDIRADRIEPLVQWTRRLFPGVRTDAVVPWAGLRPMMPDMMPRVGRGRLPGVFYNTGHGHLGWTLSAATADAVAAAL